MSELYLIRIPASGGAEQCALPQDEPVTDALLAALLHTDVTERLRLPVRPAALPADAALCYYIDARGGEKALPANFTGTCFYHTGCPIFGDLLLVKCRTDAPEDSAGGFSAAEAELLMQWLRQEFGTMK